MMVATAFFVALLTASVPGMAAWVPLVPLPPPIELPSPVELPPSVELPLPPPPPPVEGLLPPPPEEISQMQG